MTLNRYFLKLSWDILLLIPLNIFAQIGNRNLQVSDTVKKELKSTNHSLFAGCGYGSNMIYLGSTISQDQPYVYGAVSYGFKNELFTTVSAVHLSGTSPFMAFYIASINYNHVFNNWFDIAFGCSRYQVASSLTDTLFKSFTYADVTFGFDWKLLYSKISAGGLFSEDNLAYFQLRNSRYFQTPDLLKGKANISFDPYVNLLFGTLTEVETNTESTYYYSVSSPYRKWRKHGQDSSSNMSYSYTDRFGLLEIDFGLPIDFNTNILTVEVEPSYVIPFYDDTFYPGTKGFIFQMSLFLRIF